MNEGQGRVKFSIFLKQVLDYQLKEHEKFLGRLLQEFKSLDTDNDGILNEEDFRMLISSLDIPEDRIEKFL